MVIGVLLNKSHSKKPLKNLGMMGSMCLRVGVKTLESTNLSR